MSITFSFEIDFFEGVEKDVFQHFFVACSSLHILTLSLCCFTSSLICGCVRPAAMIGSVPGFAGLVKFDPVIVEYAWSDSVSPSNPCAPPLSSDWIDADIICEHT